MHCVRTVTENLYWVGANDHRLALFENIHPIPKGVSYNAYLLLDEKSVLFDTVDWSACRQLLENLEYLLNGKPLDYLVINHMEPDHGASIEEILLRYPKVRIISTEKAFMLMRQFASMWTVTSASRSRRATPIPSATTPSPLWELPWSTGPRPW